MIDHGKVIARGTSDALKKQVGGERLEIVVDSQHLTKTMEIVSKVSGNAAALDEGLRLISSPVSTGDHEDQDQLWVHRERAPLA